MAKKIFTAIFLTLTFALLIPSSRAMAYEKEFTVFDMRKTLPLHDDDPVYRDYYVNIGSDSGVQVGAILAIYRHVPVIDIYRNKAEGDLVVPIGHMKVIQVQKSMSVCRVASIASEKQIPVVQYETVMMGDQVRVAENAPPEERTPAMAPAPAAESPKPSVSHHKTLKVLPKVKKAASQNLPMATTGGEQTEVVGNGRS